MLLCLFAIGVAYYYYSNQKKVIINEKRNIEYFYTDNTDDVLLETQPKYICSQLRRRDLEDIVSMDVVM